MVAKTRFFWAIGRPDEPEYDPSEDDTPWLAMILADMGTSGWFECAACGDPSAIVPAMVTNEDGRVYAYGLCVRCNGASLDEAPLVPSRPEVPNYPLGEQARETKVNRMVSAALERFIAAGEPSPAGWEQS
jgi:hypothetical protein